MSRLGVSLDLFKKFLGIKFYFSIFLPLVFISNEKDGRGTEININYNYKTSHHFGIYNLLIFMINRLRPVKLISFWSNYISNRNHYTDNSLVLKYEVVRKWFDDFKPNITIDLGSNTGEFSKLALHYSAYVVAIDQDHDCIQKLYAETKSEKLFCVVADITDLNGGCGWIGKEFPSLFERLVQLRSDLVLMLALIHHLSIVNSIPLSEIADFCSCITESFLIVELISPEDSVVNSLISLHMRNPMDFSIEKQRDEFNKFFTSVEEFWISKTRILCLMKKNAK
jgi:hypothetical protein